MVFAPVETLTEEAPAPSKAFVECSCCGAPPTAVNNTNLDTLSRLDERLNALATLRDGWDGDDAPRPTADALRRASGILAWATESNIDVASIDPDVLGGVAIYMQGASLYRDREIWVSVKNEKRDTLVASEFGAVVWHSMLTQESMSRAASFLKG